MQHTDHGPGSPTGNTGPEAKSVTAGSQSELKRNRSPHGAAEVLITGLEYANFNQLLPQLAATAAGDLWAKPPTSGWKLAGYDAPTGQLLLSGPEGVRAAVPFPTNAGCQLALIDSRYLLVSYEDPQSKRELLPIRGTMMGGNSQYQLFDIGQSSGARIDTPTILLGGDSGISYSSASLAHAGSRLRLGHLQALNAISADVLERETGFVQYKSSRGLTNLFLHSDGAIVLADNWRGVESATLAPDRSAIVVREYGQSAGEFTSWRLELNHRARTYTASQI